MKSFIIVIILFLIGGAVALRGISKTDPMTTEVTVLRDITDKYISQPEVREIMTLFDFSGKNTWNAAIFRYQNVSDVSFNQIHTANIESVNPLYSDEFTREKQIKTFADSVSTILTDVTKDGIGKSYSSIYFPLATELNRLSQSTSQKRILIIYSDLMQNDETVSLYSKKLDLDILKTQLEKQKSLTNLQGVEVYIIFQPENIKQDHNFQIISQFYSNLLAEKGARVIVSASLSN